MKNINPNQILLTLRLILSVFGGLVRLRDCAGLFPTRGRQLPTRSVRLAPQRNRQRLQRPDDGGRRAGRHLWLRPPGLHSSKITCHKTRNEHTRLIHYRRIPPCRESSVSTSCKVRSPSPAAASTGSSTPTTRTTRRCTRASTAISWASDLCLPGSSPGSKFPHKRR